MFYWLLVELLNPLNLVVKKKRQVKNVKINIMKIDFINSWRKGNKKDTIYDISIRLGRFTVLEIYCNPKVEHRFILLNFGFELIP